MTDKLDVMEHVKQVKQDIKNRLELVSSIERDILVSEIAAWSFKQLKIDQKLRGPNKTKVIRSFFGRFKNDYVT